MFSDVEELIKIRSTADRPGELHRALEFLLDLVGPGFTVERFESNGKPSALLYAAAGRPDFRILLNAHVDVVPGRDDQFRPRRDGDRLYGRGAQDMKAAAVVLATVFRELAHEVPYPLGLQLVTDEEVGGYHGTAYQLDQGVTAGFVIIGEQSDLRVATASRGILQIRLEATGVAAHAAYPWLGDNALRTLLTAVDAILARYPDPETEEWVTTATLARISTTNTAINQVPADGTAWIDIRFPPEDTDFAGRDATEIADFLQVMAGKVTVHVESLGPPHTASRTSPDVALLRRESGGRPFQRKHGAADSRFFSARGIDAVIFGPGGGGQHGPAEYLTVTTLDPYYAALRAFLRATR